MLKTDDINFWNDCKKCFKSTPMIDKRKIEEWFTSNHTHDEANF